MSQAISQQAANIVDVNRNFLSFLESSQYMQRAGAPDLCDFTFGNPQDMPIPAYTDALRRRVEPQNKEWFAYKMSEPNTRAEVAKTLRAWRGIAFEDDDITMTNGGFAALAITIRTVIDPGDEVIMIIPPWFFYETLIAAAGGVTVRVGINSTTYDLDTDAIRAAITPKTRAIIVNSPNNPTGKIYPASTLTALADVLTEASQRNGRIIYLLSDEAYSRIVYDGQPFVSPVAFYPYSFLIYTYGKTLLAPGQRIGYVALPPTMPERETIRGGLFGSQLATGYSFPNALLQHAIADLEKLSIDIEQLQVRRDRLYDGLTSMGYEVHKPEGTFYMLPRSPLADDIAFTNILAEQNVFCLPGTIVEQPGTFRISLTANDDMVERSLPRFEAALRIASARL